MDIERLTREAKALIHQKQYGKAVDVMDQIKILDPNNEWIQENEDVYKELNLLRERRDLNIEYQENVQRQPNNVADVGNSRGGKCCCIRRIGGNWPPNREKFGITSATSTEVRPVRLCQVSTADSQAGFR